MLFRSTSLSVKEPQEIYEDQIQKLEAEARNHVRVLFTINVVRTAVKIAIGHYAREI